MNVAKLSHERLGELVRGFSQARIAVLGDFFLDKYLDIDPDLEEVSVETGKPAHQVSGVRCSPGAAGTVVCNLASLQAGELHAIGFAGDDGEGFDLRKQLHSLGCRTDHLHVDTSRSTPTYLKPRNAKVPGLAGEHSRYDTKNHRSTDSKIEQQVLDSLANVLPNVDAVIILDQVHEHNCGVVTDTVRGALAEQAKRFPNVVFWADSRRLIHEFRGVIVKPNQFEAVGNENPLPGDFVMLDNLVKAGTQMRAAADGPVVITRAELGMLVSEPDWTIVPGITVSGEIDPTGAGDSATAGTVLALCAGAELPEAAVIGNLVASITVRQLATTGVAKQEQLADQLQVWEQQQV